MEIGNTCWFFFSRAVDAWPEREENFLRANLIQLDLADSHFENCVEHSVFMSRGAFFGILPAFKCKMCLTKTMTELNGNKKNFSHVMHTP